MTHSTASSAEYQPIKYARMIKKNNRLPNELSIISGFNRMELGEAAPNYGKIAT
jgi:hypothetical protein